MDHTFQLKYGPYLQFIFNLRVTPLITTMRVEVETLTYTDGKEEGFYTEDPDAVQGIMHEHGVCILGNVLTQTECDAMNKGAAEAFNYLTKNMTLRFDVRKPNTYKATLQLEPLHGGLFQHHGLAHAPYTYDVRQNPAVVLPFARIWSVKPEELVSSFDGVNYHTSEKLYDGHHKIHLDQGFKSHELRAVQGFVTANPTNAGDSTFRCLWRKGGGAHMLHADYAVKFGLTEKDSKRDWHQIAKKEETDQLRWYKEQGCEDLCMIIPGGGMVLWDSRTPHSGIEPSRKRYVGDLPLIRNVVYTCYVPRHRCSEGNIKKRHEVLDNKNSNLYGRTFSHYPDNLRSFSKYPSGGRNKEGRWPTKEEIEEKFGKIPPMHPATHALTPLGRSLMYGIY
jgi:hypothetical protein